MYILAIETTGPFGSVALLDENASVLGIRDSRNELSHMKDLIPMTAELLEEAGVSKTELSVVAVSAGPGSFTGIRIGVSTARALCQTLNIGGIAVPTLEGFLKKIKPQPNEVLCAVINARRGQVYGVVENFMEPGPYMMADVLDVIEEKVLPQGKKIIFMGDGVDAYGKMIADRMGESGEKYRFMSEEDRYQDAASVGLWAVDEINKKGFSSSVCSYNDMLPDYMRKAEAEQKLAAGELPICKGPVQE